MKGKTFIKVIIAASLLMAGNMTARAALTTTDPLLLLAVANGTALGNERISTETDKMAGIGLPQNSIGIQFNAIKTWEKKYNSYLKTAEGYAETLVAGTTLYSDAVQTLQRILDIKKAVQRNPEGLAANLAKNEQTPDGCSYRMHCPVFQ